MSKVLADAIIALVDAKIEQAFAEREEGADGYRQSTPREDEMVRQAEAALRAALDPPTASAGGSRQESARTPGQ